MTLLVALACFTFLAPEPPQEAPQKAQQVAPADIVSALETAIQDAIARAEPSVVAINRLKGENPEETLAVRGRQRPQASLRLRGLPPRFAVGDLPDTISFDFGSGVVVGNESQILTAYHVVRARPRWKFARPIVERFDAEIIAADPRSDLAVIAPVVDHETPAPHLKPIALGDSTRLRKGSFLIALGNPFDAAQDGKPSASWGILSNIARKVELGADGGFQSRRAPAFPNYPTLLQLDAKLNLGMSGGAVINLKGELVGLTTMAASPAGFDAMAGYAMPMDRIGRRAVEALIQGKEIEYGLLGISNPHGLNTNRVEGVATSTPADGVLVVNDEIIGVDGTPVHDWDSLILNISAPWPGRGDRAQAAPRG